MPGGRVVPAGRLGLIHLFNTKDMETYKIFHKTSNMITSTV